MKRWSKLHSRLKLIMRPNCDVRLSVYRMQSQRGTTDLPCFQVIKDGVQIWQYPRKEEKQYPYSYSYEEERITDKIRQYIDSPKDQLRQLQDETGIYAALRWVDRRINMEKEIRHSGEHPLEQNTN